MTAACALARILFWAAICIVLCALIPVGLGLLVAGHALIYVSIIHRDACMLALDQVERIAREASRRTR